jgi:hypothetical protein
MAARRAKKLHSCAVHARGGVVVGLPAAAVDTEVPADWRPVTDRPSPPAHDPGA